MTRLSAGGVLRGAVIVAALAVFPFVFPEHWVLNIAVFTLMYAALATSWNLVGGFTGYISLGNVAFFGLGAYAVAILFTKHMSVGSGYRPFFVLPLIGLAVGLVSVPIGWIAFRTRAATFAIVTLTLIFVAQQLAFNLHSLTNGSTGILLPLPPFSNSTFERPFFYGMLALLVLALGVCWWVRGSKLGLALFAIRDDEDRARGLGQRVTTAKLMAFSLSAGLTAMIGAIWAYYLGQIYPQFAFDPLITIGMVLMVYLGGKGTLWGPVVGARRGRLDVDLVVVGEHLVVGVLGMTDLGHITPQAISTPASVAGGSLAGGTRPNRRGGCISCTPQANACASKFRGDRAGP